jgi:hypothetical protein
MKQQLLTGNHTMRVGSQDDIIKEILSVESELSSHDYLALYTIL